MMPSLLNRDTLEGGGDGGGGGRGVVMVASWGWAGSLACLPPPAVALQPREGACLRRACCWQAQLTRGPHVVPPPPRQVALEEAERTYRLLREYTAERHGTEWVAKAALPRMRLSDAALRDQARAWRRPEAPPPTK